MYFKQKKYIILIKEKKIKILLKILIILVKNLIDLILL